jgi:hypothetical protein
MSVRAPPAASMRHPPSGLRGGRIARTSSQRGSKAARAASRTRSRVAFASTLVTRQANPPTTIVPAQASATPVSHGASGAASASDAATRPATPASDVAGDVRPPTGPRSGRTEGRTPWRSAAVRRHDTIPIQTIPATQTAKAVPSRPRSRGSASDVRSRCVGDPSPGVRQRRSARRRGSAATAAKSSAR